MANMNIFNNGEFKVYSDLKVFQSGEWTSVDGYVYRNGEWNIFTKTLFEITSQKSVSEDVGIAGNDKCYYKLNASDSTLMKLDSNGGVVWEKFVVVGKYLKYTSIHYNHVSDNVIIFYGYHNGSTDVFFVQMFKGSDGSLLGTSNSISSSDFPKHHQSTYFSQYNTSNFLIATNAQSSFGLNVRNLPSLNPSGVFTFGAGNSVVVGAVLGVLNGGYVAVYTNSTKEVFIERRSVSANTTSTPIAVKSLSTSTVLANSLANLNIVKLYETNNQVYVFYKDGDVLKLKVFKTSDLSLVKEEVVAINITNLYNIVYQNNTFYICTTSKSPTTTFSGIRIIKYQESTSETTVFQLPAKDTVAHIYTHMYVENEKITLFNGNNILEITDLEI